MNELSSLQQIAIFILPLLFAITVHEAAHGWAAYHLGDDTAYNAGRVTLNPIKHIDLIGTIILPLLMYFSTRFIFFGTGFIFGWAKPVPVNILNLKRRRRDMALVALAGPLSNFIMVILWAIVAKLGLLMANGTGSDNFLIYLGESGIFINLLLMILNLLPILPLDGGRILHSLLPPAVASTFGRLESFGLILILVLLATGILGDLLFSPIQSIYVQILTIIGLPL